MKAPFYHHWVSPYLAHILQFLGSLLLFPEKSLKRVFWKLFLNFGLVLLQRSWCKPQSTGTLCVAINLLMFSVRRFTFLSAALHLTLRCLYLLDFWGVLRYLMLVWLDVEACRDGDTSSDFCLRCNIVLRLFR
jgi:hypothetical protein